MNAIEAKMIGTNSDDTTAPWVYLPPSCVRPPRVPRVGEGGGGGEGAACMIFCSMQTIDSVVSIPVVGLLWEVLGARQECLL